MLRVHGQYNVFDCLSVGSVFRRLNKVPALTGLRVIEVRVNEIHYNSYNVVITISVLLKRYDQARTII